MGNGIAIMSKSHARLVPPRAKYIERVSIHLPEILLSHSVEAMQLVEVQ